jgi:beta-lactamase superfamily II metal-dependent hydrolase
MPYCQYPSAFVHEAPGGKKAKHLIWGDFINKLGPEDGDWAEVRARGETGWMRKADLTEDQMLEVNFVDIGQGDGCFLVIPQEDGRDKFVLIDAGEHDNMFRFLRWRFGLRQNPERRIKVQAAVLTHPDADHYKGFKHLIGSPNFEFENVYHNGIVERTGADSLGPKEKIDGTTCLTDVIPDRETLQRIVGDPALVGKKLYPNLLKDAFEQEPVCDIRMLSIRDRFLPGYEGDRELSIQVLGPVPEDRPDGKPLLRWFGDAGKTKNGHSVVLKLRYRDVSILLGGDLNIPAEQHLLRHYTGLDPEDRTPENRERIVAEARKVFESDVAKACHHGSADFTDLYLRAVNPIATVISSGDGEPHCHPRPDALGAFGKAGRGERPLLFSTELARSSSESIKNPHELRREIDDLFSRREAAEGEEARAAIQKKIDEKLAKLERSVAVYGMINLRTDGRRILLAQKLEEPRAGTGEEWDMHKLEPGAAGLQYVSKHLGH